MSNTFGNIFKITSFGESHGAGVGVVIDGCPPGIDLDEAFIQAELDRRKPGQSRITTQRKEADGFEFFSGEFEGKSTGAPITILIKNQDQRARITIILKMYFAPLMRTLLIRKNMGSGIIVEEEEAQQE